MGAAAIGSYMWYTRQLSTAWRSHDPARAHHHHPVAQKPHDVQIETNGQLMAIISLSTRTSQHQGLHRDIERSDRLVQELQDPDAQHSYGDWIT